MRVASTRHHRAASRIGSIALLVAAGGCAQIVGISDWTESSNTTSVTSSGETASSSSSGPGSTSTTSSGTGGAGGSAQPNCIDGFKNGDEGDIDCGGDACKPCLQLDSCNIDSDCITSNCEPTGTCGPPRTVKRCPPAPDPQNPNCADCVINGAETDLDCGGTACGPCALNADCVLDVDCASGFCNAGACNPPQMQTCPPAPDPDNATCVDCATNGSETDQDCGGDACSPCLLGAACLQNVDCKDHFCDVTGHCAMVVVICPPAPDPTNPTCADCATNGGETDIDCGGDACAPCASGKACGGNADCASLVCAQSICM